RENGVDLSTDDRAQAATAQQASLLLSIHGNYDGDTHQSHGFECFPAPPGRPYAEESLRFATCLTAGMRACGHRLRGENGIRFLYYTNGGHNKKLVESSDTRIRAQKSFGMVEKPHCPAVLAEQCFISNYSDVEAWASPEGCAKAARIYYEAICTYFDTQPLD
ncbi:MAG: N-acetylmuramoyl-L-alanine amidase, partial [Ruthenibacterium sp.]